MLAAFRTLPRLLPEKWWPASAPDWTAPAATNLDIEAPVAAPVVVPKADVPDELIPMAHPSVESPIDTLAPSVELRLPTPASEAQFIAPGADPDEDPAFLVVMVDDSVWPPKADVKVGTPRPTARNEPLSPLSAQRTLTGRSPQSPESPDSQASHTGSVKKPVTQAALPGPELSLEDKWAQALGLAPQATNLPAPGTNIGARPGSFKQSALPMDPLPPAFQPPRKESKSEESDEELDESDMVVHL